MDLVIPTGGDPRGVGITEAEKMKEMLIKMGIEKLFFFKVVVSNHLSKINDLQSCSMISVVKVTNILILLTFSQGIITLTPESTL